MKNISKINVMIRVNKIPKLNFENFYIKNVSYSRRPIKDNEKTIKILFKVKLMY